MTAEGDETREELIELISLLNADAKALRRRGYVGVMSERYRLIHEVYINEAIDMLEAAGEPASLRDARLPDACALGQVS